MLDALHIRVQNLHNLREIIPETLTHAYTTHAHTHFFSLVCEKETDLLSSNLVILDISGLAIEERVPDQHNNALKGHLPSIRQVYKTLNKALQCKTKEKEYGIRAYSHDLRMYRM